MYRTGDNGRRLENGLFDFIVRKDFQVKLRGQRIEIGEIEHALQQIPEIKESLVVFTKDRHGDNCLVAYIKPNAFSDDAPKGQFYLAESGFVNFIKNNLLRFLPKYMVPSEIVICRSFPLTMHGKIDRKALIPISELHKDSEADFFTPQTEVAHKVYEIWKEVLGRKSIGGEETFFTAGGHSLKAVQVITNIIKTFGCDIPLKEFYKDMTLQKMSELIENKDFIESSEIEEFITGDPNQKIFPITPVQREMWVMNNIDSTGIIYNIQIEFFLKGNINVESFLKSLKQTVQAEETFRSVFPATDGEPVQVILDTIDFVVPIIDISTLTSEAKEQKYLGLITENGKIRFQLDQLPLFSFRMVKWSSNDYRLLMAIHHLIFDGWSLQLFMKRLQQRYVGLESNLLQYRNGDYALWLNKHLIDGCCKDEISYWDKTLEGIPKGLMLPHKPNANINEAGKYGRRYWWTIPETTSKLIDQMALQYGVTPFVLMMSAYQLVLGTTSGQCDVVVGTPYANRKNPMVTELMGYFTNMVSIRSTLNADDTLITYILRCNEMAINAFSNATTPFGEVANHLKKGFTPGTNPIYQAIFVMQNWPHDDYQFPEFTLTQREIGNDTAKVDLLLNVEKCNNAYTCWLEYDTELYDEKFVLRTASGINHVVDTIIYSAEQKVSTVTYQLKRIVKSWTDLSCIVVGEGPLSRECINILMYYGISIQYIISEDITLKEIALQLGIPYQNNLNDLSVFEPVDYIFSINNNLILGKPFTSLARKLAINYNDAPLPHYAGKNATNWAIINREKEYGVSWHKVVDEIDAGDIVSSQMFQVMPDDTAHSLKIRCFDAALKSFNELIDSIVENKLCPVPQLVENQNYLPYAVQPDLFGLITPEMTAKSVDALIRATNFGDNYANEFALPLLYLHNEFYIVFKALVIFDKFGTPGQVVDFNERRGFYCSDGLILPEILYDRNGEKADFGTIMHYGDQMPSPDKPLVISSLTRHGSIARFEPFWREQLSKAAFLTWPIINREPGLTISKSKLNDQIIAQLDNHFPEQKTENILLSTLLLFFLRLSNQSSGTVGFVSADLPFKNKGFEDFFNTWVPLNITIDDSNAVATEIGKILVKIKKIEKSETFTRSTRIRYPELRKNASDKPGIILSKASAENNFQDNNCITINVSSIEICYNLPEGSKYSGIDSIAESFDMFLQNLIESPEKTVNQIAIVSDKKSIEITKTINKLICKPVVLNDVIDKFIAVCAEFPDKTAIFDLGKSYSYYTFSHDVEKLYAKMQDLGLKADQIVAIVIDRNYNYFISIMAVLRCGATFLPIDPTIPSERMQFFCTDANVSLILVDNTVSGLDESIMVLNVTEINDSGSENFLKIFYNPDSVAYIIYTSGSTGIPKGVKISRKALANFISGALGLYQITDKDRVLQFSNLNFDGCIEEIFTSFCSGASIYLRTAEMLLSEELLDFTDHHQISVWDLPTAFWRQVIQSDAYINNPLPDSLRQVIIGGEAVSTTDIALWNKCESNHRLFNTYGPTETTVVALAFEIKAGYKSETTVPIGQPLPGYKLYITDTYRHIVPEGIAGELLLAGDSLALGYLNRQTEQNKAFIWLNTPDDGLQRCYCTGDLVSADKDGLIYYQGRIDAQVKIRGFRVEPGEIEQQICSMKGVETSVVVASEDSSGEKSLFAFYIGKKDETDAHLIKEELKKRLPAYMVPEIILRVNEIPLTSNGKVDTKSLISASQKELLNSSKAIEKPTNETEQYVLELWKKVLSVETMGIDDNFFDFGGHSLKAVQLMTEIKKMKEVSIPLASLISNPTVRTFASLITSKEKQDLWQCLVPIRPKGTKTPLFLIHGAGLNILLYQSLAHNLKDDRPIYAFQAKGLDGSRDLSNNIEEMAIDYIEEIEKIQPKGPFMLLGFSLGGFIAYEMAKRMTETGHNVIFTGVIDSDTSMAKHIQSPIGQLLSNLKTIIIKPIFVLWLLLVEPMEGKRRLLRNKYNSIRFQLIFRLIKLGIMKDLDRRIKFEEGQPMFLADNVVIAMTEAIIGYEIKPASIELDLFKAQKTSFYIPEPKDYGWGKFARKGVVVHTMPSEHSLIFAHQNSKLFAEVLDQRLDEIETKMEKQTK
jgi:amino acid adenylation domain-containing protein